MTDQKFTQWASLFVTALHADQAVAHQISRDQSQEGMQYPGITPAAGDLLRAIDAGGVPAFVSAQLKDIARDNGVQLSDQLTPNDIIEAIRNKVHVPSAD